MGDGIEVLVSPSEQQYKRFDELARAVEHRSNVFQPIRIAVTPFDVLFKKGDRQYGVEFKEIPDWYASLGNEDDHLVEQLLKHLESPFPSCIVIFGSQDEVVAGAPKMSSEGCNDWNARLMHVLKQLGFKGDCEGFNVAVRYQSKNHKRTFDEVLSMAHNICDGPSICGWMHKKQGDLREVVVLAKWFNGVSEKRAKAMLMHFGGIVPMCLKLNGLPDRDTRQKELMKIDGIGKTTADEILYRVGKTAGWT